MEVARAEAERTKMTGAAEGYAIEAVGKADAERMRMRAAAYKQFGEAAILSLVLDTLPKVGTQGRPPTSRLVGGRPNYGSRNESPNRVFRASLPPTH